jgi:hypothetical protein
VAVAAYPCGVFGKNIVEKFGEGAFPVASLVGLGIAAQRFYEF